MSSVSPHKLKMFRELRNLTQRDVVERAAIDRTPVSLSTIKRLESPGANERSANPRIVRALAKVLEVQLEELAPDGPETSSERDLLRSGVWLKQKINRQTDLAYQVVEATYGIPVSAQVSLAPLFCALLAEASLRWRKGRLEALNLTATKLGDLMDCDANLSTALAHTLAAEHIEAESIGTKDVLGQHVYDKLKDDCHFDPLTADFDLPSFPWDWKSPFMRYIEEQAQGCADVTVSVDTPAAPTEFSALDYSLGDTFLGMVHGNHIWAKLALENGSIRLSDIPTELMATDKGVERCEFMASKCAPETREQHARDQAVSLYASAQTIRPRDEQPSSDSELNKDTFIEAMVAKILATSNGAGS